MAPETLRAAFLMIAVLGICVALVFILVLYVVFGRQPGMPTIAECLPAVALAFVVSIGGAYITRRILWSKPYIVDQRAKA
jgi:hypothetical protein